MKNSGVTVPIFTNSRQKLLAAATLGALALTACGGADTERSTAGSGTQDSSATATSSEQASALAENFTGAEALANAEEVQVSTTEVETAEELYTGVQEALSKLEPITVASSETPAEGQSDEAAESEEISAPREYLSEATVSDLEAVTVGSALDQYIATATEYALSGWHVEGSSQVVGTPRLADGDYRGQDAKILEVCLDSSDVKVLDSAGNQVNSTQIPRSLNIFTLIEDNGEWKIASHDFPNNADC